MPLIDIVSAALSGPAGRVLEGSVRAIVAEVLQDRGYASPAEVLALREDLQALSRDNERLLAELSALRGRVEALEQRPVAVVAAPAPASPARPALDPAAAERMGMSLEEHQRWRSGGLPGRIGPDGYLEIDGRAWRVDPSLEGRPFTLSQHDRPRVMVDGKVVKKESVGGPA